MKRKMLQYNANLSEELGTLLLDNGIFPDKKKMFGHEVFFLNTYMFCGANESGIFVNIGKDQKEEALENEDNVKPFEPLQGTVMKDYLLLENAICSDKDQLLYWINKSVGTNWNKLGREQIGTEFLFFDSYFFLSDSTAFLYILPNVLNLTSLNISSLFISL